MTDVIAMDAPVGPKVYISIPIPAEIAIQWPEITEPSAAHAPPHVTALYIGEVPEARLEEALALTEAVAALTAPFELTLAPGLGWFQNLDGLWIAHKKLSTGGAELTALNALLRSTLTARGFTLKHDYREFKPHATLAYCTTQDYSGPDPSGSWISRGVTFTVKGNDPVFLPFTPKFNFSADSLNAVLAIQETFKSGVGLDTGYEPELVLGTAHVGGVGFGPLAQEPFRAQQEQRRVLRDSLPESEARDLATRIELASQGASNDLQFRTAVMPMLREACLTPGLRRSLFEKACELFRSAKGGARGGRYFKRVPKTAADGSTRYEYVYDASAYEKRPDAHVDGAEARHVHLTRTLGQALDRAGPRGLHPKEIIHHVAYHGSEAVTNALVAHGVRMTDDGRLTRGLNKSGCTTDDHAAESCSDEGLDLPLFDIGPPLSFLEDGHDEEGTACYRVAPEPFALAEGGGDSENALPVGSVRPWSGIHGTTLMVKRPDGRWAPLPKGRMKKPAPGSVHTGGPAPASGGGGGGGGAPGEPGPGPAHDLSPQKIHDLLAHLKP